LLDRRTRIDTITGTFGDRQWLSGQGRLQCKRSYEEKDHYGSSKAKLF
jgi:hypothetical protein